MPLTTGMHGMVRPMKKRLDDCLNELKIKKCLGSGNTCPRCGLRGLFGSIVRHDGVGCQYIICGWCHKITKVKEI